MRFWLRRTSWLVCGLLAAGIFPPQSLASGDGAPRVQATDIAQKHLLSFVSEPLPGHPTAQGAPSFYGAANLYQYLDGGADVYLLYDFQLLLHEDFKSGQADLTVDLFDMGSAEDAFGMYAAERAPGYTFLDIGKEAYRNEGILNFLQDRYYIKLAGFGPRLRRFVGENCACPLGKGGRNPQSQESDFLAGRLFRLRQRPKLKLIFRGANHEKPERMES